MAVQYNVFFESENGEISIVRTFNNKSDSGIVTEEILKIQDMCEHFSWNEPRLSKEIGKILFTIVNGDNQLVDGLKEAVLLANYYRFSYVKKVLYLIYLLSYCTNLNF